MSSFKGQECEVPLLLGKLATAEARGHPEDANRGLEARHDDIRPWFLSMCQEMLNPRIADTAGLAARGN